MCVCVCVEEGGDETHDKVPLITAILQKILLHQKYHYK